MSDTSSSSGPRPLSAAQFTAQAKPERVIDGDTFVATIAPWFRTLVRVDCRLADLDTHEIYGVSHDSREYERGMEEKRFVEDWFLVAEERHDGEFPLTVAGHEVGKYGRPVVTVLRKHDGAILNDAIREKFDDVGY